MSEFKTRLHSVPSGGFLTDRDKDKKPILDVRELGIDFGGLTAVDNFNLMIGRNEIAGLIGPNGAGKTTVFNLLTNVYQPTRGSILIDGMPTAGKKTYQVNRMGVARTFQNIRLFKELSVIDNIKVGLHESMKYNLASSLLRMPNYWKEEKKCTERALELLDIFHMADLANTQAGSLPYGAQRRLEIMRALATGPKLLLLDEPAAGMNPSETAELTETIRRIRDEFNIAVLLIEHDMSLVMGICEGIAVLNFGRIIAKGTPDEIRDNPQVIEAYLGKKEGCTMADTLLKVDGINVYYGNIHAVKDISFTVNAGEIVTLIGANGAGKSTTLKTISGLLKPRTGDVLYKGKSIKGVRAHKIVESGLAQVPEGRHVFLHMTVDENLDMGAYTQPASTIAANKEKVFTLFPRLKERRKQLAGTMSGGEQQMLAMGRALMSNASMLMLDEPSMGLSPLLVQEIFDIIRDIHKEGMTILLVEQNAQMALSVADRAYVLETGRVVMDGTGAELLTNERVRSAYLGG